MAQGYTDTGQSLLDIKHVDYVYSPLAYHDSWLSVDPIVGCRLDCRYCYMRSTHWTAVRPERLHTVPEIVAALLGSPYFDLHETVLSFGNQTDPFLPENVDYTLKFLSILEDRTLRNPVALVTKQRIPLAFLERAGLFRHVRPIFCLSYSGLPKSIERGVNPKDNEDNLQILSRLGFRVIHFWRPLMAQNGSPQVLEAVLDFVARYAAASVYIGLKLSPLLNSLYLSDRQLWLSDGPEQAQYGEYIPPGVEERLRILAAAKYPEYPLYKHTSCAVSHVLGMPDYNATRYHDAICLGSNCPFWQRDLCNNARFEPAPEQVQVLLDRLSLENQFAISEGWVQLSGTLTQEEYVFLLHGLNYPIRAQVKHSRNLWGSIFKYSQQ